MTGQDVHTRPERIAVAPGLFEGTGRGTRLLASRCLGCGQHYFPRALSCRAPDCTDKRLEDTRLSAQGRLYSYTRQRYQPPGLFRMEDWAPYALGLVDLPEGLRILALISGPDPEPEDIGRPMQLGTRTLYVNEAGQEVITYCWHTSGDTP